MALGEEGGEAPSTDKPKKPKDPLTTMALGEEGGSAV